MGRHTNTTTCLKDMSRAKAGSQRRSGVKSWDDAIADFKQRIQDL